jgi:septum formation protein
MSHDSRPRHLVLASGSPRRQELLRRLGVPFVVDPGDLVERRPNPGEDPGAYALSLAEQKASAGAQRDPNALVVGADTVVTIDGLILGKPRDQDHALETLQCLRGRCHRVITAVAVCTGSTCRSDALSSEVWMKSLSIDDLRTYVLTGEPMDKAGAYALQGLGGGLVENISGCYNNVVGLPLCVTGHLLTDFGYTLDLADEADLHVPTRGAT